MSVSLLLAAGTVAALTYVGTRDARAARAARRAMLDDCAGALSRSELSHGADSFPRLCGLHRGHEVRVDLLCDTMTIRRLPQLWMRSTLLTGTNCAEVVSTTQLITHGDAEVRRTDSDQVFVNLQLRGHCLAGQGDRTCVVPPGGFRVS